MSWLREANSELLDPPPCLRRPFAGPGRKRPQRDRDSHERASHRDLGALRVTASQPSVARAFQSSVDFRKFPGFGQQVEEGGHRGSLSIFFEVTNVYDRKNVRADSGFEYRLAGDGRPVVIPEEENWLPVIPSFGLAWEL